MRIGRMVLAASLLSSTAHAHVAPSQPFGPLQQRILDNHNRERAAVGSAPLRWNVQLERDATEHARLLARTGRLVHAPREGRGIVRENLNQGLLGWGPDQLMRNWLSEKRYFHGGIYPDVCTGGWSQCAHYTQVIWPGTTDLGCGMAAGGRFSWFVCRYSPGGNKDGKRLGVAMYRAPSGSGPIESAKSRQLLGTPGQSHRRSNLSTLCASSGKELKSIGTRLEQLKVRKMEIVAEIRRVESAINAAETGVADYDPSLLERLLGTTRAPSNEQLIALQRRLVELLDEMRSNEAETTALFEKILKIEAGSGPCGRGGEREEPEEVRRPY